MKLCLKLVTVLDKDELGREGLVGLDSPRVHVSSRAASVIRDTKVCDVLSPSPISRPSY